VKAFTGRKNPEKKKERFAPSPSEGKKKRKGGDQVGLRTPGNEEKKEEESRRYLPFHA